jgi:WD40 repeat protein
MDRRKFVRNALLGTGVAGLAVANVVLFEKHNQQSQLPEALRPDQDLSSIAFSLRGNQVFAASADDKLAIWDPSLERRIRAAPEEGGKIRNSGFLSSDTWVAAIIGGSALQFYSARDLRGSSTFTFDARSHCVAFSPISKKGYFGVWLAAGLADHTIRILWKPSHTNDWMMGGSITTGTRTFHITRPTQFLEWTQLKGHSGKVNGVSFSKDGALLASASSDHTIRIWDTNTWKQVDILRGHTGSVNSAEFSADGQRLVSASADGTVIVWNRRTAAPLKVLAGHHASVVQAKFLNDPEWIVSAADDNAVAVWSVTQAREGLRLSTPLARHPAFDVSPDEKLIATSSGTDVKFWQTSDAVNQAKSKLGMS